MIDQIRSFVLTVELSSVSLAAELQHMVQPSVSRQLHKFQESFPYPLFMRSGRKLQLTTFGHSVYQKAKQVLETVEELQTLQQLFDKRIRIGASLTSLPGFLPLVMRSFLQQCQPESLTISTGFSREIDSLVSDGKIDIGVVSELVPGSSCEVIPLFDDPIVLVCGKTHRLYSCTNEIDLLGLNKEQIISSPPGTFLRKTTDDLLYGNRIDCQARIESDDFETQKELVKAGFGVAFLPYSTCLNEINSEDLRAMPLPNSISQAVTRHLSIILLQQPHKKLVDTFIYAAKQSAREFESTIQRFYIH